jgi:hypothetical protein
LNTSISADVDEPGVIGDVVDPVRDRLAALRVREVMIADRRGSPFGRPSLPFWAYWPTSSFFLVSMLITGSPAARYRFARSLM